MGKVVGIGGGRMGELETLSIDEEIIELTGKSRPNALFVPTASNDSLHRWDIFQKIYGNHLGCDVDVLLLLGEKPDRDAILEKILSADIIYVGGGNTLKMMRRWRLLGVDHMFSDAYNRGTVLAGSSAGCICWFDFGHSDSRSFYSDKEWEYIRVRGMGLLSGTVCPHYNSSTRGVERRMDFHKMIRKHSDVAIALDNFCAIEVVDNRYRIISAQTDSHAYALEVGKDGTIREQEIQQEINFEPVKSLVLKT
jgi:dipeptidase E